MKALVAVTFDAARVGPSYRETVVTTARDGLAALAGTLTIDRAVGGEHLLLSAVDATDVVSSDDRWSVLLSRTCRTSAGELLDGRGLLDRLVTGQRQTLRELASPFGGCFRLGRGRPILLATDRCGLHHVYWYQGAGWAAISTSSLVLASMASESLDERAVGIFALVGNYLDCDTPYRNVRKLDAGSLCSLADGVADVQRYASWDEHDSAPFSSRHSAISEGKEAIALSVEACLDAHPAPSIELSGGLDSRAVLAAVPVGSRRGLHAVTLGEQGSADVEIATRIARRWGLEHDVVDTSVLRTLAPEDALARARHAARRRDFAVNGPALAVLDSVEERVEQVPRLGGANGEFGRGFYYPGQRPAPAVTDARASRLANWRVLTNSAVDTALFVPEFAAAARQSAIAAIQRALHTAGHDWLSATDEFYLRQRTHRWVGNTITPAGYERSVLLPFVDRRYIDWARRARPGDKRGSRLFSEILASLDPELGALTLDRGGLSPAQIARPAPADRVRLARSFASKAGYKVFQRARRRGKLPTTTGVVAELAARAWSAETHALGVLESLDFLDQRVVRAVASGERAVSSASVAFLIDVHGIVSFLADRGGHAGQQR